MNNHAALRRRAALLGLAVLAAAPLLMAWLLPQRDHEQRLASQSSGLPAAGFGSGNADPENVRVEVKGRRFRWHFRELQASGLSETRTHTAEDHVLRLPVGANVELLLTSDDYIYFLSIPELGIRQIAVPGLKHSANFVVSRPLTCELRVDALCNFPFYHGEWMGRIVAESRPPNAAPPGGRRHES